MNDQKIKKSLFQKKMMVFSDELKKEVYAYFISNNISIYGNKLCTKKLLFYLQFIFLSIYFHLYLN